MTHRLNAVLFTLITLIAVPFYWLLLQNPSRDVAPHPVSIAQLRVLADSMPGPRPAKVEMTVIGGRLVSGNVYAAGAGVKRKLLAVTSFRLPVPGGKPVVIDTGTTLALSRSLAFDAYLPNRQRFVDSNMREAGVIVATSGSAERLGGLAAYASRPDGADTLARAKLNAGQVPSPANRALPWPAGLALRPAVGLRPTAVAPGIVAIPAPGASPGAQMIYARLRDGREYLFAGDVAPLAQNFQEMRVRSRYSDAGHPADRAATMRWLVTIAALGQQSPGLIVVPGNGSGWILDPRNRTGIVIAHGQPAPANPAGSR
ncbi:MAG: hypothetical protein V4579_12530 [Pseudomonadota bacterium]